MPANFLHGVETVDVTSGARTIRQVKTAIIALVGTAPIFAVDAENQTLNEPVLVLSTQDAAKYFGSATDDFTIPQALDAIFDQGHGTVVVVNVFDPAVHKTTVALANHVLDADDEIALGHPGLRAVVVKNAGGTVTYVVDVDYTVDAINGVVKRKASGAILAAATLKIGYDYADPTLVDADDIVGAVGVGGDRSGIKALDDVYSLFGFNAKILIAPVYATQVTVSAELEAAAERFRAIALIDAPIGTTVADAITGRGSLGTINFESASRRVYLLYPHTSVSDGDGGTILEPYSQRMAGVIAAVDQQFGYHVSPSNQPILGIIGMERSLTARINDAGSEVNLLNEAGITTIFNAFGTGFRTWGNRSAAWPGESGPETFISAQRVQDVVDESIELAMLPFLDGPLNSARVDAILDTVNAFMRTLIGRGALIPGSKCLYDPADNPPDELALGHVVFQTDYMAPPATERITFKRFFDLSLLRAVGARS